MSAVLAKVSKLPIESVPPLTFRLAVPVLLCKVRLPLLSE